MRTIVKHTPNLLTCLNLFCGCLACIAALKGDFIHTTIWVVAGALFDFFDGLAARLMKVYSSIGKDLDSLADMITFGLAPTFAVFTFLQLSLNQYDFSFVKFIPYIAFLLVVFSALRLAKFNVDDRQGSSFIGLPTPANALFWVSLLAGLKGYLLTSIYTPVGIICLILLFSYLLIAEIPMFSLKVKDFSWNKNMLQYILVLCTLIFIALFHFGGISLGIFVYILMSVFSRYIQRK